MLIRTKHIYKIVSDRLEIPKDLVDSIGSTVLASLRSNLSKPTELGYDLRKIGVFFIKHTEFIQALNRTRKAIENGNHILDTEDKLRDFNRWLNIESKMYDFKIAKKIKRTQRYEEITNKQSKDQS